MPITKLPLEIIHMILDCVEHHGDDFEAGRLTWETRRALRACSLISYLWLAESRKRLFRTIPVPCTDISLHAFKRIFSSPSLTFGSADVRVLDVTGKAPSTWGWQWWRTHQRKVIKVERERVEDTHWDSTRIFDRFFDWMAQDTSSATKLLRGVGEIHLFEVAFEISNAHDSLWVFLSPKTQHSLHRSFPSLTKLVLQRVKFSNDRLLTNLLRSLSSTLQSLDMECVAVDHVQPLSVSDGKKPMEVLLPNLHTLRMTSTAVEVTAFLAPLPNLRTATFDIGDEDLRKDQISSMIADALASSEHLQNLCLQNACSGSFRNAEPLDNGPFFSRILEKASSIEHLTMDVRSVNPNAHLIPMFSQKHPNTFLTSLHIPELYKFKGDHARLDDTIRNMFPQLQVLQFNLRVLNTSPAMRAQRRPTFPPLPFTGPVLTGFTGLHVVNDIRGGTGPGMGTGGLQVEDDFEDDRDDTSELLDYTMQIVPHSMSDDEEEIVADVVTAHAHAQAVFPRMDEAARQAHLAKVEATLERMRREDELLAFKSRVHRTREAFEKFANKLPWCHEERRCLRPKFVYDK
ncbi:hypothetical protein L218DRAFT_958844 [Marasmius fiardii PR-910]|nr:hypothetical protein L218DRAFT_958844 [Marasmius fiardii PR-910]